MELKADYKNTEIGAIPEGWEVKKMEVVAQIEMGQSPSSENYNTKGVGLPLVQGNADIKNRKTIIRNYTSQITKICKKGDIIMSVRAPVGEIATATQNACIGRGVCALRYPNKYLFHYLLYIEPKWAQHSTGSTFDSVNSETIKKLKIPLPEQTAIAKVLSDTDNLLQTLEKKIAKKRLIKQGAMQELLKPKEGWVVKSLGDIATMSSGGTPSTKNTEYYNGKILWVSISDITKAGKFIDDSLNKITGKGLLNSSAKIFSKNTVLLAMYASIGKCCIATSEMSTSQAILGIEVHKSLLNEYLYYFLLFNRVKLASQGQQGTQSNLNKGMVENINLPLPSIKEQTQIVTILSDMDTEIESLEKQLSKYKQVKQGVMQNLLTGKIRLV